MDEAFVSIWNLQSSTNTMFSMQKMLFEKLGVGLQVNNNKQFCSIYKAGNQNNKGEKQLQHTLQSKNLNKKQNSFHSKSFKVQKNTLQSYPKHR